MRATGIVRKADILNRIVIPKEICRTNGITDGTPMEIFTYGDNIILRKYTPGCIFCDSLTDVAEFKGKHVCAECRKG
jgi:transcriptional pleiotropic regulator of transition state genes